jgi:drug/metabolite transporter (DMT)-like permease
MPTENTESTTLARGYTIALVSAVVLSSTAIFIRYLTQTYQIPPLVLAFWRDLFVIFTLGLILVIAKPAQLRVKSKLIKFLVLYGFVLALFNSFWTLSVAINGAAIATVLAYTSAGFTALLGRWFLKEPLGLVKVLAVIISLSGCVLASEALDLSAWLVNPVGILTGMVSGLAYALYSLMGRAASQRGIKPWTTLLYTFTFASLFLLLINLLPLPDLPGKALTLSDFLWLGDQGMGWLVLFLLAAGPTLAGYGLYNVSLDYLPSSIANLILTSELVFTTLIAYLVLGERLNPVQIAGSLLIIVSVVLIRIREKEHKIPQPPIKGV